MMTLEEAKEYGADYDMLPLVKRRRANGLTPVKLARILRGQSRRCYLMENTVDAEDGRHFTRYAYVGYAPALELSCTDGVMQADADGVSLHYPCRNPLETVREVLAAHRAPHIEGLPPFCGGFAGYFSYESIQYTEPEIKWYQPDRKNEEVQSQKKTPYHGIDLMYFDKLFVFDRETDEILLICNIEMENVEENYRRALTELEKMEDVLRTAPQDAVKPLVLKSDFQPLFPLERYVGMVEQAKALIARGDVSQIVLSNGSIADAEGSLLDTYEILRRINPSNYIFYWSADDLEAAGASPETMLRLADGKLFTYPLAGTSRRGRTKEEDAALEAELLGDEKCIEEHNMLVDDARNELGAVSRFGSVKVEAYKNIIRCSHVMHIGSIVTGTLAEGKTALDAIAMMMPAGVVSGSPKVRGCEAISEIEQDRRGIYGGALGYLSLNGDADFCIFFRTACLKDGKVSVRAGGGITADSVPETEHQECLNKAAAVVKALEEANRARKNAESEPIRKNR